MTSATLTRTVPGSPPRLSPSPPRTEPGPPRPTTPRRATVAALIVLVSLSTLVPRPAQPPRTATGPCATVGVHTGGDSPNTAAARQDACVRTTRWRHTFPAPYLGETYALISANPSTVT